MPLYGLTCNMVGVAKLKKVSFGWPVQQPQKDQAENFTTMHSGLDTFTEPLDVDLLQKMAGAIGNDSTSLGV